MSMNYDGVKTVSQSKFKKRRRSVNCGTSFSDLRKKNIKTKAFRGFEKIPRVLLPRYDITPYLTNGIKTQFYANRSGNGNLQNLLHAERLLQCCSVKLLRYNVESFKCSWDSSPRSDVSLSELTDTGESMANLKCKICEKLYESEKKLLKHQENKHMIVYRSDDKPQKRVSFSDRIIVHELKEYHKCRKCTKIFEDYKSLKYHMKQRHKKRKCYICNYCNKKFVDRMFFKVHIKLHCDICGLLLQNKSKYLEHRRSVCRVLKMHKCKTCDTSFFKFMDLKDHSYEHLSTFFICDICKDQFETMCAVSHHISFLHSKQRPTALYGMRNLGNERLYLCNFCDESSVERDNIEAHVSILPDLSNRAMTGYKDYYFCDQCLQKFDTEQNMLQHKWSHFLKTSDNSQVRPKSILCNKPTDIVKTFNIKDGIPEYMKPVVVIKKLEVTNYQSYLESIKPKRTLKKTLFSNYQCQVNYYMYNSLKILVV
jgi:hypothetical protein